jgi:hypothetical protein
MTLIHHFPTPWDDPRGHPDTDCSIERCGMMPTVWPLPDDITPEQITEGQR